MIHSSSLRPATAVTLLFAAVSASAAIPSAANRAEAAEESKTRVHTLLLPVWDQNPTVSSKQQGMLAREILRQSLLISARDEFGLATRDRSLRESLPSEMPAGALRLDLVTTPIGAGRVLVVLHPPNGAEGAPPLEEKYHIEAERPLETLTTLGERLSRTRFAEILENAGCARVTRAEKGAAAVSEGIARQIDGLSLFAQFAAVRGLHDEMRRNGESPALLGALVRGYSHLGVMTERHWSPAHKAFKARALVYAERLANCDGDPRLGLWHRAYARAFVGLHASASEDLDKAESVQGALPAGVVRPAWVDVLTAWCRFEPRRLVQLAERRETGGLAEFLLMLQAEGSGFQTPIFRTAEPVLKRHPDSLRALESIAATQSLGAYREVSQLAPTVYARAFPLAVKEIPLVPNDISNMAMEKMQQDSEEQTRDPAELVALVAALRKAGAPGIDRQEPSLQALASLADDAVFLCALRLLTFLNEQLAVAADSTWESLRPVVAQHPFKAALASFRSGYAGNGDVVTLYATLDTTELEAPQTSMLSWMRRADQEKWNRHVPTLQAIADGHDDPVLPDLRRAIGRDGATSVAGVDLVARLTKTCPHQPATAAARAATVTAEEFLREAAGWEARYANSPEVLLAVARRHQALEKKEDARRCYQRLTEVAPEFRSFQALAEWFESQKDDDRRIGALEKLLEYPVPGLEHARVRVTIAEHLMQNRDYQKAKPYAVAAAETHAAWALSTAMTCCERLEEWEASEEYARAVAERYQDQSCVWFYWCRRTGRGDLTAAQRLAESFVTRFRVHALNSGHLLAVHILKDEPEQALKAALELGTQKVTRDMALQLAVVADQIDKAAERDELLERVIDGAPIDVQQRDEDGRPIPSPFRRLGELFRKTLKNGEKGTLDLKAYDELWRSSHPGEPTRLDFLAGLFLTRHGSEADAEMLLQRCATSPANVFERTYARFVLRKAQIKIEADRLEERPGKEKPAPRSD